MYLKICYKVTITYILIETFHVHYVFKSTYIMNNKKEPPKENLITFFTINLFSKII